MLQSKNAERKKLENKEKWSLVGSTTGPNPIKLESQLSLNGSKRNAYTGCDKSDNELLFHN
jgi:hypothetical protein